MKIKPPPLSDLPDVDAPKRMPNDMTPDEQEEMRVQLYKRQTDAIDRYAAAKRRYYEAFEQGSCDVMVTEPLRNAAQNARVDAIEARLDFLAWSMGGPMTSLVLRLTTKLDALEEKVSRVIAQISTRLGIP